MLPPRADKGEGKGGGREGEGKGGGEDNGTKTKSMSSSGGPAGNCFKLTLQYIPYTVLRALEVHTSCYHTLT